MVVHTVRTRADDAYASYARKSGSRDVLRRALEKTEENYEWWRQAAWRVQREAARLTDCRVGLVGPECGECIAYLERKLTAAERMIAELCEAPPR